LRLPTRETIFQAAGLGAPGSNGTPRGHDKVNFSLFYRF
jgi:hypothetical protein